MQNHTKWQNEAITHLSAGLRQKATVQKATERNVNIELMEGSMC